MKKREPKYYMFLNGLKVPREKYITRGVFLNECSTLLPPHLSPIIENDDIAVRQDAEFPVPAFYIISTKTQVHSVADFDEKTSALMGILINIIRKAMRDVLEINRVNIYLEEKLNEPHYHVWLLPMWQNVLSEYNIEPRIWEGNILKYIKLFKFENEGDKILKYNEQIREYLRANYLENNGILLEYGFR